MKKRESLGMLLAGISGILYGTVSIMAKAAYALGSNPFMVTFGRFLTGALCAGLVVCLVQKRSLRLGKKEFLRMIPLALLFGITPTLLYASYQYISSGLSMTLHFTYPVLVMVITAVLNKKRPGLREAACAVLCTAGVVLLCQLSGGADWRGLALALVSGVTYSAYIVGLDRSGLRELNVMTFIFWLALLSAVEIFILSIPTGNLNLALPPKVWIYYALLGVVAMVGGASLFQVGVRLCGPVKTSLLSTMEPLTGVIVGLAVFHEVLTGQTVAGMVLILLAVLLLTLPIGKKADAST